MSIVAHAEKKENLISNVKLYALTWIESITWCVFKTRSFIEN